VSVVSVYCVFADGAEAERIGRAAIEERLAACINILGPCRSIYRWHGKVEQASEVPAILKTTTDRADALVARIGELHGYDVPCITVSPVTHLLADYAEWVEDECREGPKLV
jgi:periplasmic divalent cation tolerance protein